MASRAVYIFLRNVDNSFYVCESELAAEGILITQFRSVVINKYFLEFHKSLVMFVMDCLI